MFCSECGKQVEDSAKFCSECGAVQSNVAVENSLSARHNSEVINKPEDNSQVDVPANNLNSASQTQFTTILKAAAVIGGCIWGIYIIVGWIAYSQLQDDIYGIAQSMKPAAFTALIIQSFLASMLLVWGFKK